MEGGGGDILLESWRRGIGGWTLRRIMNGMKKENKDEKEKEKEKCMQISQGAYIFLSFRR